MQEFKILLIPSRYPYNLKYEPSWEKLEIQKKYAIIDIPESDFLFAKVNNKIDLRKCFEIVQKYKNQFDLIIGECTGGFVWNFLFRYLGDNTPFAIIPHYNQIQIEHLFLLLLSSQMASTNNLVFSGSISAARPYQFFNFPTSPIFPFGINVDRYNKKLNKTDLRIKLGLGVYDNILLYTGRVDQDKNIIELLLAFHKLKKDTPAKLIICFNAHSNQNYLEDCLILARAIGDVYFFDNPHPDILIEFYNAADLFVTTAISMFETFGRSPLEALACGIPVVAPKYNGFRETVPDFCGELVPPIKKGYHFVPDIDLMAETIGKLLSNKEFLISAGNAGVFHAQKYSENIALSNTKQELLNLIKNRLPFSPNNLITLETYHPTIRSLFEPIADKPIIALFETYLNTRKVPLDVNEKDYIEMWKLWFSSFFDP